LNSFLRVLKRDRIGDNVCFLSKGIGEQNRRNSSSTYNAESIPENQWAVVLPFEFR
jgi:hypothetical protein